MEDSEDLEKKVQESVQKWVTDNPVEFGAGEYKDSIFERCKYEKTVKIINIAV